MHINIISQCRAQEINILLSVNDLAYVLEEKRFDFLSHKIQT